MIEGWLLAQVFTFGALVMFSSYLTYRQRIKRMKKLRLTQAVLV